MLLKKAACYNKSLSKFGECLFFFKPRKTRTARKNSIWYAHVLKANWYYNQMEKNWPENISGLCLFSDCHEDTKKQNPAKI